MPYADVKLKTPEEFVNKHPGSKVFVISNGPSAKFVLENKQLCREYFDIIIIANHALKDFDDIADYHICTEKTSPTNEVPNILKSKEYNVMLPRILNWKGIEKYGDKYNLYKTTRLTYNSSYDLGRYKQLDGKEGLFIGPLNSRGMSTGTVTLQSMHMASIFGAKEIYIIGADLIFRDQFDHYYQDNQYRDPAQQGKLKPNNRIHIVDVEFRGKTYQTTDYFRDSAKCLDDMITGPFSKLNVYDFSDGLVSKAIKLDVKTFFNKE